MLDQWVRATTNDARTVQHALCRFQRKKAQAGATADQIEFESQAIEAGLVLSCQQVREFRDGDPFSKVAAG